LRSCTGFSGMLRFDNIHCLCAVCINHIEQILLVASIEITKVGVNLCQACARVGRVNPSVSSLCGLFVDSHSELALADQIEWLPFRNRNIKIEQCSLFLRRAVGPYNSLN